MERVMSIFAANACGGDIDSLFALVCVKYPCYRKFYRLVEELSDSINDLEYEFSDDDSLHMVMIMDKDVDISSTTKYLKSNINDSKYSYKITSGKGKIKIIVKPV